MRQVNLPASCLKSERRKGNLLKETLDRYRQLTVKRMYSIIPDREPRSTLYDLMLEYPAREGKGLRPALCLSACQAFGGSAEACLNSATAIELYHNAFLIHDDIEDGSTHRRGKPTLWAEHGMPVAVNAGDGIMSLALKPLINNVEFMGVEKTFRVIKEITNMAQYSVEGQAMELGWIRDNNWVVTEKQYLLMCLKKTCWYTTIIPCRIGAIIAGAGEKQVNAFNRIGYFLGIAFQIQDDILNLTGDENIYGKETAGDIWEGKRTIMLIYLLHRLKGRQLNRALKIMATPREKKCAEDILWILNKMKEMGSIEYAKGFAYRYAKVAKEKLDDLFEGLPPSIHVEFLREVVFYVIEREL